MAEAVREESEIKGIKLPDGLVSKWVTYSDNGNATLSDFKSVKKPLLYNIRILINVHLELNVNLQKTQGFLMGKFRYEKDTPLDI